MFSVLFLSILDRNVLMKIIVLNGSPKGVLSLTFKAVEYAIKYSNIEIEFEVFNVSQRIKVIDKLETEITKIKDRIRQCDGVIWCTPVYYHSVPAQLIRFIEILYNDKNAVSILNNKTTTLITTSIHIGDNFAHDYMHSVCDELKMNYVPGFATSYFELESSENRISLTKFIRQFAISIEKRIPFEQRIRVNLKEYNRDLGSIEPSASMAKKLIIIDSSNTNDSLQQMINLTVDKLGASENDILDLNNITIHGGCLHCLSCLDNRQCFYKDDLNKIYREKVLKADILILAFKVSSKSVSYRIKCFIDRFFVVGFIPVLAGKLTGIIVSGDYQSNIDLQNSLAHTFQTLGAPLTGAVSDEYEDRSHVNALIDSLCFRINWSHHNNFTPSINFLGFGSSLFHDHFISSQRLLYWNDYMYFQKKYKNPFHHDSKFTTLGIFLLGLLCHSKYLNRKIQKKFKSIFVRNYQHTLQ